jgi:RND family efflux transporter MFP subunit
VHAVFLCAVLASACAQEAPEAVVSDAVVPVTVEAAATGDIRAVIRATGIVTAAPGAELIVVAPEAARVAEIARGEGDAVAQGDLLVRFDIPTSEADVARQRAEIERTQAHVANARAAQTRAKDLFDRGVGARKDWEDADRDVAEAQASLAQAQATLASAQSVAGRSMVRAPFAGQIARRFHNVGDVVEAAASDPVLRLVDTRRLEVTALIAVTDVPRVALGATAHLGDGGAALRVTSRPTAVDPTTGAVPVRLAFSAPGSRLAVGTPVPVDIDAERRTSVLLVPLRAVVREGEDTAVFVVDGDKASRRAVTLGLVDQAHAEVRSGLTAGERVITQGHAGLPDGAAVTVENAAP